MFWKHLCKTSWRCFEHILDLSCRFLEDSFARRPKDVLKTSWRHLEDVWARRIYSFWSRRFELPLDDVFWSCMPKLKIIVSVKTFWRCLEGVFWKARWKTSSRVFKTNACWLLWCLFLLLIAYWYQLKDLILVPSFLRLLDMLVLVQYTVQIQIFQVKTSILKVLKYTC